MSEFVLTSDPFAGEEGFIKIVKVQLNIRNFQNDVLVADPESSAAAFNADVNPQEEKARFFLVIYKMLSGQNDGLPVAVGCTVDDNDYLLSVENNSVILKESVVPEVIPSESSEFIFFVRGEDIKNTTFESSAEPGFALACSEEDSSLVLKPHSVEEPESTAKLLLESVAYIMTTFSQTTQEKIPYDFWNIQIDLITPPTSGLESTASFIDDINEISDLLNVFKPSISAKIIPYHIQNHMQDFLVADPEKHIVTFEPNGNEKDEQSTFYVNKYRQSNFSDGLPVVLSCKVQNRNYLVCAASESVILKLNELPQSIEGQSELIFYMKDFSPGHPTKRLEPLSDQKLALACNLSEKKLILKQNKGEIDETMEFILEDKTKKTPQA